MFNREKKVRLNYRVSKLESFADGLNGLRNGRHTSRQEVQIIASRNTTNSQVSEATTLEDTWTARRRSLLQTCKSYKKSLTLSTLKNIALFLALGAFTSIVIATAITLYYRIEGTKDGSVSRLGPDGKDTRTILPSLMNSTVDQNVNSTSGMFIGFVIR